MASVIIPRRGQVLMFLLGLLGYWQTCQATDFTCSTAGETGVPQGRHQCRQCEWGSEYDYLGGGDLPPDGSR
jgi:hypothetical protein